MDIPAGLKLRHLRAFLSVAETGSVSAAARRAHVSQPALSKTVSDLERILGAPLFDRTGKRMELTAAGLLFHRHAGAALRNLGEGVRGVTGAATDRQLSVGVLPTVASGLFPRVALEFSRARSGTRLSVTTGPHRFLMDRLRSGAVDLMLGRMPLAQDMSGLRFDFLYEDPVLLVARADHPFAGRRPVDALRVCDVILPNHEAIIRQTVDAYLGSQGLKDLEPVLETVSRDVALPLLLGSDMLWFISRGVVSGDLEAGRLAALDPGAAFMSGAVGITRRSTQDDSDDAMLLTDLLQRRAALPDTDQ